MVFVTRKGKFFVTGILWCWLCLDRIERKNTSGGCHFIGGNLIMWCHKKQEIVALSTPKAKYIFQFPIVAYKSCGSKLNWKTTMSTFFDNSAAITLTKNPILHRSCLVRYNWSKICTNK